MDNLDLYYNLYDNMINNYEIKSRNYSILQNVIDINDSNKYLLNKIKKIINNKNIKNKLYDR